MSSERARNMELAEKIARKEPLDVNKVTNSLHVLVVVPLNLFK